MTDSATPLRDSALAVAAGDMTRAADLYDRMQKLRPRLASFDEDIRERAVEIVLQRWYDSLQRNLDSLRDHAGTDASRWVKSSSRRGADLKTIEKQLGRSLSDDEQLAFDPFDDDEGVVGYLLMSLRNAARDEVRRRKLAAETKQRATTEPSPEPPSPFDGMPKEVLAHATALLERELLPAFQETNPNEWTSLEQIEAGRTVEDVALESLGPDPDRVDLARRKTLVYQHWSRARMRLIRTVEERPGDKVFRTVVVPALKTIIDERFRRKVRSVRKAAASRPTRSTGESR